MKLELGLKYYSKGYIILKNVINKKDLANCQRQLLYSYKKVFNKEIDSKNIHEFLTKCEHNKKNWDKMYVAFKDVCNSKPFYKMTKNFEVLTKNFFNTSTRPLSLGYAIGIRNSQRTSYNWHQEKTYYSKIKKATFHYQFPFFGKCSKSNGTMSVLEGSHTLGEILNYSHHRKFKKGVQSYIPKDIKLIKKYFKEKFINLELGDVCIFHENIVHKSNINKTNKIRFAGIQRQEALK